MSEAINLTDGLFITEDGEELPIIEACDEDGDPCDLAQAVQIVAGPDSAGDFWTIEVEAFEEMVMQ